MIFSPSLKSIPTDLSLTSLRFISLKCNLYSLLLYEVNKSIFSSRMLDKIVLLTSGNILLMLLPTVILFDIERNLSFAQIISPSLLSIACGKSILLK